MTKTRLLKTAERTPNDPPSPSDPVTSTSLTLVRQLMVVLTALGACFSCAQNTPDILPFHHKQAEFRPWSNTDLRRAESLFEALFSGTELEQQAADWQSLGMEVSTQNLVGGETVYLLSPRIPERQGAGYYFLRRDHLTIPEGSAEVLLQAPHQFHDRQTGHIAVQMFSEHPARALVLNSAHRKRVANRGSLATNPDLAHNANTLLMSFTRGFIAAHPRGRVVQVHGFNAAKRNTAVGRNAQVIVSGGANWPTALSTQVADCLSQTLTNVYLYPRDVSELGGTTNSTANWLAMIGKDQFLHLENSSKMRENLLNNLGVRSLFWSCLSKDTVTAGNARTPVGPERPTMPD